MGVTDLLLGFAFPHILNVPIFKSRFWNLIGHNSTYSLGAPMGALINMQISSVSTISLDFQALLDANLFVSPLFKTLAFFCLFHDPHWAL